MKTWIRCMKSVARVEAMVRLLPVRLMSAIAALAVVFIFSLTTRATVSWTGTGGTSWGTSNSWSPSGGPGTTDTASFTNTGSSTLPGTVTSVLNTNRTIGGLAFNNTAGDYQTLDLGGYTLTVAGNLNFNTDQSSTTTTTIRDGNLSLTGSGNFFVGSSVSQSATGSANLSGLTSLTATLADLYVGNCATVNSAAGSLTLAPTNTITATSIIVGSNSGPNGNGVSSLTLGTVNTLLAGQFSIAQNVAGGSVTLPAGGSLTLGSSASPTALSIASGNNNSPNQYTGLLDASQGSFTGYLSSLTVGQEIGSNGSMIGTFNAGTSGTIAIGAAGTTTANIVVANSTAGGSNILGTVNFGGLSTLTANLNTFTIGTVTSTGSASGTVTLAAANTINANSITIGSNGTNGSSSDSSSLILGATNSIVTSQLTIAQNNASGTVTLPAGGSLTLGSPTHLVTVAIETANDNSPNHYSGVLDLSKGSFTGYLSSLTVGQQVGTNGTLTGTFNAGNSGSVVIGATGTSTASIIVANSTNGASGITGNANFGGLSSLTANLNTFTIGTVTSTGAASGTVTLAASNTINANSIIVGSNATNGSSSDSSSLTLGATNSIITSQLTIAQNNASGTVTLPGGGSLTLGSPAHLVTVSIETANDNSPNQYSGVLDLSMGSFTGYLSSLTVGQQIGTNGTITGTFNAGNSGTVVIGAAGTSTASIIVGNSTNGASGITGIVNFGGLSSLTANLNTFTIGTGSVGSGATGTVTMAATNTITANSIVVGSDGGGTDSLALGSSNTILTPQLTIGQDYSTGSVTVASGGSLTLGSRTAPVNLSIAVGTTNTSNTYGGSFSSVNSTLTAYLGNVVVGSKNTQPGSELGTLTIGNSAANYITANSIVLGGNQSTGILNYGGGLLYANSITAGSGTATFNWTGGTLSVGSFGTSAIPFNLNNTGSGTLAPGSTSSIVGTTSIFGNYVQGSAASTSIDITSANPGSGYDQINISGNATLAGTLALNISGGYVPAIGDALLLETYTKETGAYTSIIPPTLPAGVAFQLDYSTPTQLVLEFIAPTNQTFASSSAFSTFGTSTNWAPAQSPGTTSNVSITNSAAATKTVTVSASDTIYRLDLLGSVGKVDLEVQNGVVLAAGNQVVVDTNATMNIETGGTVNANAGLVGAGSTTVDSGALLTAKFIQQTALTVDGTARLSISTPHKSSSSLSVLGKLTIAGSTDAWTGVLDLGNNDLDLQSGSLATVTDQLKQGYNASAGGNWSGLGITSTAAGTDPTHLTTLGVMQNNQGGTAIYNAGHLFDGIAPGASDILVKYTYYGDTNLDGKIDGSDYSRIDNAVAPNSGLTGWYNGDFNYDGVINGSDYTLIDNAFNTQGASLADEVAVVTTEIEGVTSVPEPATVWPLLTVAVAAMLGCRRRQRA